MQQPHAGTSAKTDPGFLMEMETEKFVDAIPSASVILVRFAPKVVVVKF